MHEVSLVADLISEVESRSGGQPIHVVHVRHASTISRETLEQAFRMLSVGGALADTRLTTEAFDVVLTCGCGFHGPLGHDDLISGSVMVCPACGDVSTRQRTAELELLEVS